MSSSALARGVHIRGLDSTLKRSHGSLERLGPVQGEPCIRFALVRQAGQQRAVVQYEGVLQVGGSKQNGQEVEEGSFLTPKDNWYPQFRRYHRVTFDLTVELPPGWEAVSQGQRTELLKGMKTKWSEQHPQLGIYLVAGPYWRYQGHGERAQAMVYLRQGDQELAHRYLEATHRYLDLYSRFLGPYAYSKFAAVESFWETGYGMPSFTLLGPKVMRLPFILHTSYPHEILHNWWGNGVYVDSTCGNWSEGLTAYLANHLHQERQGKGWRYRRAQLQQYTLYVAQHGKERPLSGFQARHS